MCTQRTSLIHQVDDEFRNICRDIQSQGFSISDWAAHEADDWFQTAYYCGGFDATEMEFTFSVWIDRTEYWFQLPLDVAGKIASGQEVEIQIRLAK